MKRWQLMKKHSETERERQRGGKKLKMIIIIIIIICKCEQRVAPICELCYMEDDGMV